MRQGGHWIFGGGQSAAGRRRHWEMGRAAWRRRNAAGVLATLAIPAEPPLAWPQASAGRPQRATESPLPSLQPTSHRSPLDKRAFRSPFGPCG
jgi:hypothetical protein